VLTVIEENQLPLDGSDRPGSDPSQATDYLCVDAFITTLVDARVLASALELGLIDHLTEGRCADPVLLAAACGLDAAGLTLLLELLQANQVVRHVNGKVALTRGFARALRYRDLLETKLALAAMVLPDFAERFSVLLNRPDRFQQSARVFDLFAYDSSPHFGPEALAHARRWVRFTTCLTKYEARVCMAHHDFSAYGQMMDIGGNSGEFALQVCRRHPKIRATVVDLPVVCDIGRQHVGIHPEASRIQFVAGSAFADDLPSGFDLIVFKSMLHDWPEAAVGHVLAKAAQSLNDGGTVLIFERGPLRPQGKPIPYAMIAFLLFFRSFRQPAVYEKVLQDLGFDPIQVQWIDLEMPFFLLVARKGGKPCRPAGR